MVKSIRSSLAFAVVTTMLLTASSATAGPLDKYINLKKAKEAAEEARKRLNGNGNDDTDQNKRLLGSLAWTGGRLGMQMCDRRGGDQKDQLVCAAGSVAAAYMVNAIGEQIIDGLDAREQRKVLGGISTSVETGEPMTIELPDSNSTIDIEPLGNEFFSSTKQAIYVDSDSMDSNFPTVEVLGASGTAASKIRVLKSPSGERSGASVRRKKPVHVFGKVAGTDSVLIGRSDELIVMDGEWEPLPYAIGYAAESDIKFRAPDLDNSQAATEIPDDFIRDEAPKSVKRIEIDAILKCREIDIKKSDHENGGTVSDRAVRCTGFNGTPQQLENS